jgi:tetratricopeptide (TPR) repeat protein
MSYRLYSFGLLVWLGLLLAGYGSAEAKPTLEELIISGNSLAREGEYEAAVRAYKQAWRLYNSADAAYNLGVVYDHELGFWAKAIYYYERFLALEPEAAEASQVRRWILSARQRLSPQTGQLQQSKPSPVLTRLMQPAGDEFCRQGNEYLAQEEYEAAIGAYRRAMVVNQSAAACYNLALLYDYGLNYKAKAIYYYQRFLGMAPEAANGPEVVARLEQVKQELLQQQGVLSRAKPYRLRSP